MEIKRLKELEKILNIVPIESTGKEIQHLPLPLVEELSNPENPEDNDYTYARANYFSIIEKGKEALEGALRVAEQSEHPRAYEVVAGILEKLANINKQLVQLGEDKEKVKIARKGTGGTTTQQVTNNNTAVFVGSSADLQKLIAKHSENK